jgi:aminopeptidase N
MITIKNFLLLFVLFAIVSGNNTFHPTPDREYDLLHSVIDIYIDLNARSVEGNVTHTLSLLAGQMDSISFNSKNIDVRSISIDGNNSKSFEVTKNKLIIPLDRDYNLDDLVTVNIEYKAVPKLGCFFVQPDSVYPEKHFQAWTQGEQMHNQHWVPLYDYPNDKSTFECILTVDTPYVAISNGALIEVKRSKGRRTFHWSESAPMVSYLISFVVGNYKEIKDHSSDTPVSYWVYPEHDRDDAIRSFGFTPEMLTVFNEYIGFPYPYEKYDQIIIEDFMWGGMENITLSHMSDRTMHTESVRPNHSSEWLVAHEVAHQWYGNLLTTRNWANIWLNEGITSFMEHIWAEHKYGFSEKEYYRYQEVRGVKYADVDKKPMVFFHYEDSNDLFDSNVYAKGAVVMNMLRNILGEKPFQKSLQYYTRENAYKNVESHDLKKAFEEITGKNLFWFFDQWMYAPGLPELTINHRYDKAKAGTVISVEQTQDTTVSSTFQLPFIVLIDDGTVNRFEGNLIKTKQEFFFPSKEPLMVVFDEGFQIPKFLKHKKSDRELTYQLLHAPNVNDRVWAAEEMGKKKTGNKNVKALFHAIKTDEFWGVRKEAAVALSKLKVRGKELQLINTYQNEQDERVKSEIINLFRGAKGKSAPEFLRDIILYEPNDYLVRSAVNSLAKINEDSLLKYMDFILGRESHNDIVRNSGIGKLSVIDPDSHYHQLLDLASYGGTSWSSRTTAVRELEKYIKDHPETLENMIHFLEDPNYRVRWTAINILCKYGGEEHLKKMIEITTDDLLGSMRFSSAKNHLKTRMKRRNAFPGALKISKKELSDIFDQMDQVRLD